jgi:NAD(P)-dependent dehydrogenase (short-subunit alcohol dehydrogenase family)
MRNDLKGKCVLITGGTRGIGLATGLAFGRLGAACTLTHKWGSTEESDLKRLFADNGATEPRIVCADVSHDEDTRAVIDDLRKSHERVEVLVSNVAFGQVVSDPAAYSLRDLHRSIDYSAWPLVSYTETIRGKFGKPPRYAIGLSSVGPDSYIPNYDLIACSKAVLETIARYLAFHHAGEDCRVNIIRAGIVRTESLVATIGRDKLSVVEAEAGGFMTPEEVADAIVGLCSGWLDALTGQVILVDRGRGFSKGKSRSGGVDDSK